MVGVEGFEPPAPPSQTECSGQTELNTDKFKNLVAEARVERATYGYEPYILPLNYSAI